MSWLHWFDNTALVGFYALGLVAIIASLRVIMLANPVHAILSMIVSLLALAGIFFIIGAPFAGALQVIVYAGAILVLFVFVIMILNLGVKNDARESRWLSAEVWAVPTALTMIIALVLYAMIGLSAGSPDHTANSATAMMGLEAVAPKAVGIALYTHYLMLVEVAAMLLLAALVAAYHLGKKALDNENESHNSQKTNNSQNTTGVAHVDGAMTMKEFNDSDHTDATGYAAPYNYESLNAADFKNRGVDDETHLREEVRQKPHFPTMKGGSK